MLILKCCFINYNYTFLQFNSTAYTDFRAVGRKFIVVRPNSSNFERERERERERVWDSVMDEQLEERAVHKRK